MWRNPILMCAVFKIINQSLLSSPNISSLNLKQILLQEIPKKKNKRNVHNNIQTDQICMKYYDKNFRWYGNCYAYQWFLYNRNKNNICWNIHNVKNRINIKIKNTF